MIYFYMAVFLVYIILHYIFIGQFKKHKPSMTKEEWTRKL
jgi:hypothetical protein